MGETDVQLSGRDDGADEEPQKGPSLVLIYSLVALALVVATIVAAMIVLPFYLRR